MKKMVLILGLNKKKNAPSVTLAKLSVIEPCLVCPDLPYSGSKIPKLKKL